MKNIILITPTWKRPERIPYLRRLARTLRGIESIKWLVIEDAATCDPGVTELLQTTRIDHHYWSVGPTRDKGNLQRNSALEHITRNNLRGIIYNADDDNHYSPSLFEELRTVRHIGLLPVGNLGPNGIERPIVRDGAIHGWDAGWTSRRYPVDMAGFAFSSDLLTGHPRPLWNHTDLGGETEFLEKIIPAPTAIQFLCNQCTTCLVWHNHPLP